MTSARRLAAATSLIRLLRCHRGGPQVPKCLAGPAGRPARDLAGFCTGHAEPQPSAVLPGIGNVRHLGFAGDRPDSGPGGAGWSGHGFEDSAAEEVTSDERVCVGTGRLFRRTGPGLPVDVGRAQPFAGPREAAVGHEPAGGSAARPGCRTTWPGPGAAGQPLTRSGSRAPYPRAPPMRVGAPSSF
jgi:hypothetical protein